MYCIWCSALGVVAVVLRSRCVVLCTVCKFVSETVLLKMGIQIPEICRDIYDNKSQFLHQVGTSRHFLNKLVIESMFISRKLTVDVSW